MGGMVCSRSHGTHVRPACFRRRATSGAGSDEPDAFLRKACGNRRVAICPPCSERYGQDAYHLLAAGLRGGKGVPDTIVEHPVVFVTLTALRLLQLALQERGGDDWWLHPPWNRGKTRPSVLDVERLLWQHREAMQQGLAEWLDSEGKAAE